jgi:antitoxin (DNA-binding transcriptional repressor) of toxin-antitoxin stability system
MISVNTHEAKTKLPALLALVEEGETILIYRNGHPVAELQRPSQLPDPLVQHPELAGRLLYNPTEPASEDEWPQNLR